MDARPQTVQYGLHIETGSGVTAWALTTDAGGELGLAASSRVDGPLTDPVRNNILLSVVDHIAAAIADQTLPAGADVELLVFNTEARRTLLEYGDVFGRLRVLSRSEMTRPEWWSGLGKKTARDLLGVGANTPTPRKRRVIEAATDGSVAYGRHKAASYGWAREDGRFGLDTCTTDNVLHAELTAILQLVLHADRGECLLVHVDSRNAIAALNGGDRHTDLRSLKLARKVHTAAAKLAGIEYRWVKAHQGHPLNDAADRLARLARQAKFGTPAAARLAIARNIMAEALQAHANSR